MLYVPSSYGDEKEIDGKKYQNAVFAKYWHINELLFSMLGRSKCQWKNIKPCAASEGSASLSSDGLAANQVL